MAEPILSEQNPNDAALAQTQRLATRDNAIDLSTLSLLGIFGATESLGALLRTRRGDILRVHPGDQVENMRVAAIGTDRVIVEQRGKRIELTMPGGDGASNSGAKGS